ncbi:MAG: tRNA nucleotidyltransferase (CCA-adding enzyme) [Parcubacteria group bacterium Gr01-1014_38]|nr:MAG: tRNA nucleotidyltransferase (CCA-adding enzyme) [Parcubacteria group bacterium Gr01-1014_38]
MLAERVRAAGGRALLIGGAVRDRLLQRTPVDFDVEIYGLPPETVFALAQDVGAIRDVGRAFGVLEARLPGCTMHISLPRRESKIAPGHRGFAIGVDPAMAPEDAARRRDFTMNAIAEDPLTGEILDPFRGRADLEQRLLRVVDPERFREDPLRVLRAAVFAAQFELTVDPETAKVIRQTLPELQRLHRERIGEEWWKLLLRPLKPSQGLRLLMAWGALTVLHPEFSKLPETSQNPKWHPEDDVWTHTCLAVDEAAQLTRGQGAESREPGELVEEDRWQVLLATLCHDLGKAEATVWRNGAWRSPGHAAAGVSFTRTFLHSIAASRKTTEVVVRLVREHLQPLHFFNQQQRGTPVSDGAIRKLAHRVHPASVFLLTFVADADHRGRGAFPGGRPPAAEAGEYLRVRAASLGVLHGLPAPVLRGSDLVSLGLQPGPSFADILRAAEQKRELST